MFVRKCALRRETLPILPCDCNLCDWYVSSSAYNRCFWVLAQFLDVNQGARLSFEEIAQLEGVSVEEAAQLFEVALRKLRNSSDSVKELDISCDDT